MTTRWYEMRPLFEGGLRRGRQRGSIGPDYDDLDADYFDIAIYRIHYLTKFVELLHR